MASERIEADIRGQIGTLAYERLRRGLTLAEVAAGAGLSIGTVNRVEKRRLVPTLRTIVLLAAYYDLPLSRLLEEYRP